MIVKKWSLISFCLFICLMFAPTVRAQSNVTPKGILANYGTFSTLYNFFNDQVINTLDFLRFFYPSSTTPTPTTGGNPTPTATPPPGGGGALNPPIWPDNGAGRCTHTITSSISGSTVHPGDVICVKSGGGSLNLSNIVGTRANPIIIRNDGGQVQLSSLGMDHSKFFRLTGTGASGVQYGFKVNGGGGRIDMGAEEYEVDHIEVNGGSIGMAIKTKCGNGFTKANFTQDNTVIHDMYVHNTSGEGFYIGNNDTLWPARNNPSCGPNPVLNNLWVYNNKVSNIGKDAINIKGVPVGCWAYNNETDHDGLGGDPAQTGAIALAANANCNLFNNRLSNSRFEAIQDNGTGGNQIHHNTITNAGIGVKVGNTTPNATTVEIFCNTLINVQTPYSLGGRGKVLPCP